MRSAATLGIWLALVAQAASASPKIIAVNVDGVVHPVTAEIVAGAIAQAKQENASLVLIRLNTPGGLMDAMEKTIEEMLASPVPVVTYVSPSGGRAASAGFFLLEAGDIAAMAPSTRTGAAHPVAVTGTMDPVMAQKVENDAAAGLRSLSIKRGRNAELAETTVRQSKSYTDREALDQHLIDLIEPSEAQLLADLDGRTVTRIDGRSEVLHTAGGTIETYGLSLRQRIISSIADPNIALVLLVVGALCLYLEMNSPGLIVPGVAGAIMVLVALSAISILPINWLGASLFLLAFAFFILEAKFGTHGILATGGAISMMLGAVMLVDSPIPEMRVHWSTAIALALPFSAITAFLLSLAMRARRNKIETGSEGMIGETGSVITELAPEGKIFVHGEYWDAVSPRPVAVGGRVRVTAINKLKLTVEPFVD